MNTINKEFIDNLSPIEIEYLSGYISKLLSEKVKDDTDNHENLNKEVSYCPKCHSLHIVKNGFNPKHRQKYLCKDCKAVFLSTTNTIFSYSKISYNDWKDFIASEINGLTLNQESIQISRSVTTCFYMRHKLYRAISKLIDEQLLSEEIKMDTTYLKINLKGTKPYNMPRISKKRGKSDKHNSKRGISSHKIAVFTAIDSNDNILAKVIGLGSENYNKLSPLEKYFVKGSVIISDSHKGNVKFVSAIQGKGKFIPGNEHTTKDGDHIQEINQIHSEIKELYEFYKGISSRHLPDYLNWYCFLKKLAYSTEGKRRKIKAYMEIMKSKKELLNTDICSIPMSIDLYKAYGEYHYGIYKYGKPEHSVFDTYEDLLINRIKEPSVLSSSSDTVLSIDNKQILTA